MVFVLTTVALPLTSGFTAEFLILFGAFARGLAAWQAQAGALPLVVALLAMTGMVLGATYMLRFARAILFGADAGAHRVADLRPAETASLLPLLLVILVIGIAPAAVMSKAQSAVAQLAPQRTLAASALPAASEAAGIGGTHGK